MSSLTGRVFGHYHILDRIGQGGMATVYRAHDRKADREVAIKFIAPILAQDERFLKRFRREVKVVARLEHPNIVAVQDYGERWGYAYLVMPLLRGNTLSDRLEERPLSLEEGGRLIEQVSAALEYAHGKGVIHRDVKPSNILLDADGNAMLADFGLARAHEHSASLTGSALIGTPSYMAPEQARGDGVDARCDQYALAIILYQLATGTLPYEADTPIAVVLKHVNEPLPPPRSRNPGVPLAVEQVIQKATAKDPEQRFASVSEMNQALQDALAHYRDPRANPAPTIQLPRTQVRGRAVLRGGSTRTRRLRLAAAAAAILLLVFAIPVLAGGLMDLLERASSPAEGSLLGGSNLSAGQLTSQAATIQAMSTELARSQVGVLQADEIQTAVVQTLAAQARERALEDQPTAPAEDETVPAPTGTGSTIALPLALTSGATASAVPSSTLLPSATHNPTSPPPSPSASPAGPTFTPSPLGTSAPSPTPTRTPTATRTPTSVPTSTPTPTRTATPFPSATPTQNVCALISLGGFTANGDVSWTLSNGSASTVTITRVVLAWPAANGGLDRIRFDGSNIWNGNDDAPDADLVPDKGNRNLEGGFSKAIKFEFDLGAAASGYSLTVYLGSSCPKSSGG